jgi:hypothetical protein
VPPDYTGLSYEAAQLYNPAYFSDANTGLVTAFRKLSPQGVLRIGGNLSDVTRWKGPNGDFSTPKQVAGIEYGKTYWEWRLTDASLQANKDGAITPEAIRSFGRFSPRHKLEADLRAELRMRLAPARCRGSDLG